MAKTFKTFSEELLIEHPLQLLNHPRAIASRNTDVYYGKVGHSIKYHDNLRRVGSGAEATVVAKKSPKHEFEDPHHVYKFFATSKNENNPTLTYLKHAAKNPNPYYPRIHSIKSYRHAKSGSEFHVIKMEKLHPINLLNEPEHEHHYNAVVSRMFNNPDNHTFTATGLYSVARMNSQGLTHEIKDRHLRAAIVNIQRIAKKTKNKDVRPDVHAGNVMLRRTQHGFHPVITDPLYDFSRIT